MLVGRGIFQGKHLVLEYTVSGLARASAYSAADALWCYQDLARFFNI
ncbi:hypothetical protein LNQ35_05675 [Yersinia ruckeri]|uniref:Uncharacterized protein n=1 Tax=Yersinia ruckeri TaxID=29486 RepID=A0A0A8VEM4_YERRU|nr:hypothetical protein [Yersinia ruckeri]MCK8551421.1 hypothetical protein [Yersinia ruckeri]CEK26439.1 hypothetical protein CSF007_3300 [Yersinia ruckeri]